ncbi:MAG: hypothetical protein MRY32_09445 [Rickettsiales bacterium]|nr:hypothetical protein [Rickettsiales bacterium]
MSWNTAPDQFYERFRRKYTGRSESLAKQAVTENAALHDRYNQALEIQSKIDALGSDANPFDSLYLATSYGPLAKKGIAPATDDAQKREICETLHEQLEQIPIELLEAFDKSKGEIFASGKGLVAMMGVRPSLNEPAYCASQSTPFLLHYIGRRLVSVRNDPYPF